ncbi:hypothetical protein T484DRAFT_1785788 [Baffinella frigidus]|nr:hypothetical protein T484DRAFT_1785788 [Cryptophyta sp. CCMP2293]
MEAPSFLIEAELKYKTHPELLANLPANEIYYTNAAELKYKTLPELLAKLKETEQRLADKAASAAVPTDKALMRDEVTEADVAAVVSAWTGIPVTRLQATERERLLNLEESLGNKVVGQEQAVQAIAEAVSPPPRPPSPIY